MTTVATPAEAFAHGDAKRYRRGCRCADCRAGVVAESKKNQYLRKTGRSTMRTTETASAHVLKLRAAGMADSEIMQAASIAPDVLYRVLRNAGRIHATTEQRILAVKVPAKARQGNGSLTDGTGTRRRLQALVAAGWPSAEIAFRLGVFRQQVGYLIRGEGTGQVTLRVEAEVSRVFRALWGQSPEANGVAPHVALRARRRAARRHWHPAGAWDDIDNPNEQPQYGARVNRSAAIVEDVAELVTQGHSRDAIAERLGVTWNYVQIAHSRENVPMPEVTR